MVMSIGKKIFSGILFMSLLGLCAGVAGTFVCRELGEHTGEAAAASRALKALNEARLRLWRAPGEDAASSLAALAPWLAEAGGRGLEPETQRRVKALIEAAERAAGSGSREEAAASLAGAAELLAREVESNHADLAESGRNGQRLALLLIVVTAGLGLALSFLLSRETVGPLYQVIDGLKEGSQQTASAAGQVSASAQGVARGASDQAASLQETSAAIGELGSMIKQNADNAAEAVRLMEATAQVVGKAKESMEQMSSSMAEISRSGQEIEKIIKQIDEIAFQTNLLALNAAVEAARAGEAGKGFAVVADEVRNLAQRAGTAAADTATLIGGAIGTIKEGSGLVERATGTFEEVAGSSEQVRKLIEEIAAGSQEQALSVEQLNAVMAQVDRVTQANAASAEESASASEQLTAQAAAIEKIVAELRQVVGLTADEGAPRSRRPQAPPGRPAPVMRPQPAARPPLRSVAPAIAARRAPRAEEIIPLDDKSFQDF
jgi:methyl-accepting chemotaxis protein